MQLTAGIFESAGTCSWHAVRLGAVHAAAIHGLVTPGQLRMLIQRAHAAFPGLADSLSVLVDARAATWAVDADDLLQIELCAAPIVFIVPKGALPVFQRYARAAAGLGRLRKLFTRESDALEWISGELRLGGICPAPSPAPAPRPVRQGRPRRVLPAQDRP